jgi:hypothetical protein
MALLALPAYLLVKLLAYTSWCWYGIELFSATRTTPARSSVAWRALGIGALRVGAGLLSGALLLALVMRIAPEPTRLGVDPVVLVSSAVVLRWGVWCVFGALLAGSGWSARHLVGTGARQHLWRVGGVAVSFASDAALLFAVGALGAIPC